MDSNALRRLIERYWQCDTDQAEERMIVDFFTQNSSLPADLERWRKWFTAIHSTAFFPDKEFDQRILDAIDSQHTRRSFFNLSVYYRIAVAASIVVVLCIGLRHIIAPAKSTDEMTEAEVRATVRTLLLFTSSEMNRAENEVKKQLKTAKVMNNIVNIDPNE